MRHVLGGQLVVVEQPSAAEMTQLVEVHRRLAESTPDRMPVVVLRPPCQRLTSGATKDQLFTVDRAGQGENGRAWVGWVSVVAAGWRVC
jgi:hypothetical protein